MGVHPPSLGSDWETGAPCFSHIPTRVNTETSLDEGSAGLCRSRTPFVSVIEPLTSSRLPAPLCPLLQEKSVNFTTSHTVGSSNPFFLTLQLSAPRSPPAAATLPPPLLVPEYPRDAHNPPGPKPPSSPLSLMAEPQGCPTSSPRPHSLSCFWGHLFLQAPRRPSHTPARFSAF